MRDSSSSDKSARSLTGLPASTTILLSGSLRAANFSQPATTQRLAAAANQPRSGRANLAQRFSAGKSAQKHASPGGTTESLRVHYAGIAVFVLLQIALTATRFAANASSPGDPPLLYTIANRYEPLAWMHGEERFPAGVTIVLRKNNAARPLLHDFPASADPALSFDGKTILFAAKRNSADHWQIWEIAVTNGEPHQLTACPDDCIRPFYLPDNRIVYAKKIDGHFIVEAATLANGKAAEPLPLTYTPKNSLPSDVLRDGRILFTSSTGEGQPELYTVYPDGSGVESYRCDHGQPHYAGKQTSSGDIVFATTAGLGRFTSAFAHTVSIPAPAGDYAGDVAETPSGDWLLSWRQNSKSPFQLMRWGDVGRTLSSASLRAGPSAPAGALQTVVVEPANVIQPTPVTERPTPKRFPTALHDWTYANLLCLDSYTSKYKFAEGSIHSMRLYARDPAGKPKLLGTAPVEGDGSFFVQVPGDQPLQIELLDREGKTLKRESGWFWMRQGEQRICVGCHAGPETAPENAVPMVLLKSTTPADLTSATTQHVSGGH